MTASPTTQDGQPVVGPSPAPVNDLEQPPAHGRRKIAVLLLLLLLLAALLGLAVWYLLFRQPIPLPTIPGEIAMPSYATSYYGTERPMDVAVNEAGDRIYVGSSAGDQTARIFDAQGNEIGLLEPPISTGPSHSPLYLAVSPLTGEVYVSDRPTGSIFIYDADGKYQRTFGPPEGREAWQPLGLWFDAAGNLFVADVGSTPNVVRVFDPSGEPIRTYGETAGLNFPNGVATDGAGYVYVSDSNNGRLLVFTPDGALVAQVGRGQGAGNLGLPRDVAVDDSGRLYVVDTTGQSVFVYATYKEGAERLEYLDSFGAQGVSNGTFMYPNGIAVDGRGRLYVADSGNDRVQLWSY